MADGAVDITRHSTEWRSPDWHRERAASVPLDQIDMADGSLFAANAVWPYFARLRREAPVHLCESADADVGRYWSVTRYEDIMAVDTNHADFSSDAFLGGITVRNFDEDFTLPMFIAMDPPKHDAQRKVVQPIVAPSNLARLEPIIRERVQEIFAGVPDDEPFDWVDKVSIELTTGMLATLFDFPWEDRRKLTRWSDVTTARPGHGLIDSEEQRREELLECLAYFTNLWNQRVNVPPGNDLISMLAHGESTRNMAPFEFLGNLVLLIVGGNDTTRNSITGGLYGLSRQPDEFARLRANPALIPSAVSDIIRWQTPLAHMRRTALRDVELAGVKIPKGDKVVMWYASGNRDERVIEEPDLIRIDRENPRRHLAFGFGIHRCVGNRLAEMQLRIVWEEALARFREIEVLDEPVRVHSDFVNGYERMMVRVKRF